MIAEKQYFTGAFYYFLLEEEDRFLLEQEKIKNPLYGQRIEFREKILNELVFRIERSHPKIQMIFDELISHETKKAKLYQPIITLEAEILNDAIAASLLEMSEVIKRLQIVIVTKIYNNYRNLFKPQHVAKLDDEIKLQHYLALYFLFPELNVNQADIPLICFEHLSEKIKREVIQLKKFRDKIIAHKFDPERFDTSLSYQEYLNIYEKIIKILDAISIVTTLKANNGQYSEHLIGKSSQTRRWIRRGLDASLKRKGD